MKIISIALGSILGIGLVLEISLRLFKGLGNPVLYIPDDEIGYLLAPNQKVRRGGNSIEINQYSMRHGDITLAKKPDTERIFLLGDSIVYGTERINGDEIISALVADKIQKSGKSAEVFNAATNSWGPQNELAYLKRYGLFNTDTLIMVINTDDLFATQPTSSVVGQSYSYPDRRPALALIELYQLYFAPPRQGTELERLSLNKENLAANLTAIQEIKQLALANDIQFILALIPLLREFQEGSSAEETQARESLQKVIDIENINYIDFLKIWSDFPQPEFLYRDRIHPNLQGNTKIAEELILHID